MLFSPDGKLLLTDDPDKATVRVWEAATGKERAAIETPHASGVLAAAFDPAGKRFLLAGKDGSVSLWEVGGAKPTVVLAGHKQPIRAVAFSPDGKLIASGSAENRLAQMRLWDAATGKELGTYEFGRDGEVTAIVFSPDGRILVCGSRGLAARTSASVTIHILIPARK